MVLSCDRHVTNHDLTVYCHFSSSAYIAHCPYLLLDLAWVSHTLCEVQLLRQLFVPIYDLFIYINNKISKLVVKGLLSYLSNKV